MRSLLLFDDAPSNIITIKVIKVRFTDLFRKRTHVFYVHLFAGHVIKADIPKTLWRHTHIDILGSELNLQPVCVVQNSTGMGITLLRQ